MPRKITITERILLRGLWMLDSDLAKTLDYFFLQFDTWEGIEKDLVLDKQEGKFFLKHEEHQYEVIFLEPVRNLQAAKSLGLSFRVHRATQLRCVLIRAWEDRRAANRDSIANSQANSEDTKHG